MARNGKKQGVKNQQSTSELTAKLRAADADCKRVAAEMEKLKSDSMKMGASLKRRTDELSKEIVSLTSANTGLSLKKDELEKRIVNLNEDHGQRVSKIRIRLTKAIERADKFEGGNKALEGQLEKARTEIIALNEVLAAVAEKEQEQMPVEVKAGAVKKALAKVPAVLTEDTVATVKSDG